MLDKMMEDFIANPSYVSQSKYEEKLNEYIARWPEHEELIRSRLERAMRLEAACLAAYNYGPNRIDKSPVSNQIPAGAKWYSGYIYHHLEKIMQGAFANKSATAKRQSRYIPQKHIPIVTFTRPYHAAGLYDHLRKRTPGLNIEWYRTGLGRYQVVMHYADKQALQQGKAKLRSLGISVK